MNYLPFAEIEGLATVITANAWVWTGNFLTLIILTSVFLFFAMRGGRSGLVSMMLALYIGYALYLVFPYTEFVVTLGGTALVKAVLSIIVFLGASVLPYIILRRLLRGGFGTLSFLQNLILSFLAAAFVMVLAYHVFDISNIYTFSDPLNQLFAPEGYFFWWFVAPLLGLYVLAR